MAVDFGVASAVAGTAGYSLPGGVARGLEAMESVVIDPLTYAHGTAMADVEVDIYTGGVRILKMVFVHDCGRILHPLVVDGQLIGGVAHGIGNALSNGCAMTTMRSRLRNAGRLPPRHRHRDAAVELPTMNLHAARPRHQGRWRVRGHTYRAGRDVGSGGRARCTARKYRAPDDAGRYRRPRPEDRIGGRQWPWFDDIGNRPRRSAGSGLSADEIARRLGDIRAALYRFERGELVKIETLEKLSELLGVSSIISRRRRRILSAVAYFERSAGRGNREPYRPRRADLLPAARPPSISDSRVSEREHSDA
jgi:transcriptional regulator with XRE-family HTH domain